MERKLLWPVLLFSLAVLLLTSFVAGSIDVADLPGVYAEAVSNAGIAVILAAVLVLFEWFPYEPYREKGRGHMVVDGVLVALAGGLVTVLAVLGLDAAGLGGIGSDIGPLTVDASDIAVDVAAFGAGIYVFYFRNQDCYVSPAADAGQAS